MVDIKDLKIKKRTFQFDVKRRYSNELKFKKVEKTPLEKIKEFLESFRKPKGEVVLEDKEEEKEKGGTARLGEKEKEEPLVSTNLLLKAGGGTILIFLLLISAFLFIQSGVYAQEVVVNPPDSQAIHSEVIAYDILTASQEENPRDPTHTAFVRMELQGEKTATIPISLEAYNRVVPSSVYVLRSHRYQAETYPEFLNSFKQRMFHWDIPVNEIGMGELATLPSQSLVVVPSGYIPQQMLSGSGTRITDLLDRGATVVYVGQPFFRMFNEQGAVVSSNPAALDPMRVTFDESTQLVSTNNLSMGSPLYALGGGSMIWGSVSSVSYGEGYLIAFPQTLDGGWASGEEAAADIYRLIVEMPWISPAGSASSEIGVSTNLTVAELYTSVFEGDRKYLRVYGFDEESGTGFNEVIYAKKSTKGEIYTEGHDIVPGGLGPTEMDIMADLREEGGEARLFLVITHIGEEVDRTPVATTKVALNSQPTFPYEFLLPSGNYVLNIMDTEDNRYARSYMRVGTLDIVQGSHAISTDTYRFSFYLDGQRVPVSGSVYVNGDPSNAREFENTESIELEASRMVGGPLEGNQEHTFTFELGDFQFTETVYKRAPSSIFDEPLFVAAGIIGIIALGIGFLFARKTETMYGLDIPDFPPQTTNKIPMKKETLLKIFTKLNEKYKWKHTPLTLSEIKSGFRGMLHEGKPIFISDYNLEYLLLRLIGMGEVKKEIKYYGLTSWEEDTGYSMRYLAFFRKLRDICINNAVPFTHFEKSENYDSRITILGQKIFVHLYDEPGRVIPNALSSLGKGLNIILFEEEAEKSEFYEYLSSGYQGGTILKLEIQAGSVLLKTFREFEEMVKEMKV
ncbi:hypothetical protein GF415_00505 [Candidatus Micrarchaeota archaeon]|nr:hypothetical protein [Candidatus Micrarchaeota archaeon]